MYRVSTVLYVLGILIVGFGTMMLLPLLISLAVGDGAERAYDEAVLLTLGAGALLVWRTRRHAGELRVRDGFLLVALTWGVLPLFAAMPLFLQIPGLSFTDAYFEATSGLTATGATVLSGLDQLPLSINFWRHFLHWIGGMGVIVLAVAILPLLGVGGRSLMKAEIPGPMKDAKLTPRMAETAKGLWLVYLILTVACTIAFVVAGMPGWDAVMHAFSVMGLGGFSSKDASLGHFNSLAIELVAMSFAALSAVNFSTHFLAMRGLSLRPYLADREMAYYVGALTASILFITFYLMPSGIYAGFLETLRYVAFHSISLATSLGFATDDYARWPMFSQLWILFLGSFMACSGSTGGGIKMMRAVILYKQVFRELNRAIHPQAVHPVRFAGAPVADSVLHAVLGFMFIYVVTIVSLSLLMTATGLDVITAFSAVVACLNNTGPGLGQVGPAANYGVLTDLQSWICSFAMVLGRLEIFSLLVVLMPSFWRR